MRGGGGGIRGLGIRLGLELGIRLGLELGIRLGARDKAKVLGLGLGRGRGHYNLYIVLHEVVIKYTSRGVSCTSRPFKLRARISCKDRLNYMATVQQHRV